MINHGDYSQSVCSPNGLPTGYTETTNGSLLEGVSVAQQS